MNEQFFQANRTKIEETLISLRERCANLRPSDPTTQNLRDIVADLIALIEEELSHPLYVITHG